MALEVLLERGALAAALAVEELLGQELDGVALAAGGGHRSAPYVSGDLRYALGRGLETRAQPPGITGHPEREITPLPATRHPPSATRLRAALVGPGSTTGSP